MTMKRRTFLKNSSSMMALAGSVSLGLPVLFGLSGTANAQGTSTPLPIPAILENLDKSGETATFAMDARRGSVEFLNGIQTSTMGYNGHFWGQPFECEMDSVSG